jgi:hypothetical protein
VASTTNGVSDAESWSRVVEGSGQRHLVSAPGRTLVEEGFF